MIRPLALLLALAAPAFGQEKTHDLQPEDYFSLRTVGSIAASLDGSRVAYTLAGWEEGADRMNTDLWVVGSDGNGATRLTFDPVGDGSPMWSDDGETIYFLSSRKGGDAPPLDGETQVWKVDADGGTPVAVTRVPGGVEDAKLAAGFGKGGAIYYTTPREVVEDDLAGLRSQYKDLDYGHGLVNYSTLHRLDLSTWRSEEIAAPDRYIRAFAVAPDGKTVAMVTDPDRNLITHEGQSRVDVLDVETGETVTAFGADDREGHPSPYGWIDAPDISEGGKLLFTVAFDGFPTLLYVAEKDGDGYELSQIRSEDPVTIVDGAAEFVAGSEDAAYLGEDHGRARVYVASGEGYADTTVATPGDVVVTDVELAAGRPPLVAAGTLTELGDVWKVEGEEYVRLTDVNPQTADWKFPEVQIYKWTGEGGIPVEGILELPPGYEKGDGPLPTVVVIHGGPTAATPYKRQFRIYGHSLLAAKGYAVLAPNYRGSTGYGEGFMIAADRPRERRGGRGHRHRRRGVDPGRASPTRTKLGVMGWSNGGFLTNALLQRDRHRPRRRRERRGEPKEVGFAAASSGAGVVDQVIQWGTEDTPGHVVNYMDGNLPWEFPAEYVESSPLYELNKTETPTLIHVGAVRRPRPPGAQPHPLPRVVQLPGRAGRADRLPRRAARPAKEEPTGPPRWRGTTRGSRST